MRDLINRFIARSGLRIFFRHLEVVGKERVPRSAPLVFVLNHYNSLIDPIMVISELPRSPRFIATATLWERPVLRPFLAMGQVIPVYRQQDSPGETIKNDQAFAACYDILAAGGAIALFPEGKSHDEPELQPMKTGAARIILGTEQRDPGTRTRVVPVGLTYQAKHDFRSNALVVVGDSFDPLEDIPNPDPEDREQVRIITERIAKSLDAVTLSYPSWEEARVIDRAAELFAQGAADTPGERGMADNFPVRKMFAEGYRALRERDPQRIAKIADDIIEYDHMLSAYSFRHEHIVSRYPQGDVVVYVFRTILLLLIRLPFAIIGLIMNGVPYLASKIAGQIDGGRPDSRATNKIMTGFIAAPVTWIAWALFAGVKWGAGWGFVFLILGPVSAVAAIRFVEKRRQLFAEARAYFRLRRRHRIREELLKRRNEIYRHVAELARDYATMLSRDQSS